MAHNIDDDGVQASAGSAFTRISSSRVDAPRAAQLQRREARARAAEAHFAYTTPPSSPRGRWKRDFDEAKHRNWRHDDRKQRAHYAAQGAHEERRYDSLVRTKRSEYADTEMDREALRDVEDWDDDFDEQEMDPVAQMLEHLDVWDPDGILDDADDQWWG